MFECSDYRVFRGPDGSLAIHEVYYRDDKPEAMTVNPVPAYGEDARDLRWDLMRMLEATLEPVLTAEDFPHGGDELPEGESIDPDELAAELGLAVDPEDVL